MIHFNRKLHVQTMYRIANINLEVRLLARRFSDDLIGLATLELLTRKLIEEVAGFGVTN